MTPETGIKINCAAPSDKTATSSSAMGECCLANDIICISSHCPYVQRRWNKTEAVNPISKHSFSNLLDKRNNRSGWNGKEDKSINLDFLLKSFLPFHLVAIAMEVTVAS